MSSRLLMDGHFTNDIIVVGAKIEGDVLSKKLYYILVVNSAFQGVCPLP